jgi:peptide/nickel transport system permease protein
MTAATTTTVAPRRKVKRRRRGGRFGLAFFGAAVLVLWVVVACLAHLIAPYEPNLTDMSARLVGPSLAHPFGTDTLGRDVLSRVLHGARVTLWSSLTVIAVGALIGTIVGGIAAYAGRWVGELMMRVTDLVMCFPPIILAMAIAAALGVGTTNTIIAMLIVWWPKFARLARSLVLVQLRQEYVEAAHVIGYGPVRILLRHIAPNAIGPLIVLMTVDLGAAIITFASLSFLGLGVVPPTAEWGAMIAEGREFFDQWWIATFPGLAILSVVMAFNFLGDSVRDWLDPRTRS